MTRWAFNEAHTAAEFSVRQFGFYAGDQWRAKPNFTLTYGIRFDKPNFPDGSPNGQFGRSGTVSRDQ
jgi:outer membrane receptor for ferrienterochelin and colicin